MMLLSFALRQRIVQVPINYLERVGGSSVTGDPLKAALLGLTMIGLVLRFWWGNLLGRPVSRAQRAALVQARRR